MKAAGCLLLLATLSMAGAAAAWTAPAFCKGLECPRFEVLKRLGDNIELRRYEPSAWVSTKATGMEKGSAMQGSFMRLFGYISGANAAAAKIPMTAPVLVKIEPGEGPFCDSTFTTSFYQPYKYQGASAAAAPRSTKSDVAFTNLPAMEVWVMSFGGYADDATDKKMAQALMAKLKEAKEPFAAGAWFTAGYDSPYTVTGRHNEVWVPKAATPAPAAPVATRAPAPKAAGH